MLKPVFRQRSLVPGLAVVMVTMLLLAPGVESRGPEGSIFDHPKVHRQVQYLKRVMQQRVDSGELRTAIDVARQIVALSPEDAIAHYELARLQALSGVTAPAMRSLSDAVALGFRDTDQLQADPALAPLRASDTFKEILAESKKPFVPPPDSILAPPTPGRIENGVARVTEENTRWNPSLASLEIVFAPPATPPDGPPTTSDEPAAKLVRDWFAEGTAAGHIGDLYDNLDRGHSRLDVSRFPQLTRIEYSAEARRAGADWTIQTQHLFNRPTFGNSSTAQTGGPFWRSNPRMFMVDSFQTSLVYNQYVHNHLYVFPEHADYDPTLGDVYPANVPYCVISQGSSGSDRPFLNAIALTLAAIPPDAKRKLTQQGQLMSTVQMIMRRSLKSVTSDDDYRSSMAHPVVFAAQQLDPERMVRLAHQLSADSLPPMIQMTVIDEDIGTPGQDYFYPWEAERLFDTPAAIARVYRTTAARRRIVVDVSSSVDPNDRPLAYHWVLLQGDPDRVSIVPVGSHNSRAEIFIRWHPAHPVPGRTDMMSNRIDIGVFADNGEWLSAPGFVTSFSLANEKRVYDDRQRIVSVDYDHPDTAGNYVDPFLDLPKSWKDEYHYREDGTLSGWTRTRGDNAPQEFHFDGTLIVDRDNQGRPVTTLPVQYVQTREGDKAARLEQDVVSQPIRYRYESDTDVVGERVGDKANE